MFRNISEHIFMPSLIDIAMNKSWKLNDTILIFFCQKEYIIQQFFQIIVIFDGRELRLITGFVFV
jgi:hypothetical protein